MITTNWKPDVQIQTNGSAVFIVGTQAKVQQCQDWLYNIGACDGTADNLESLGNGDYFFTVQRRKLLDGLAHHWQHDIEDTIRLKPFRGTRGQLVAKALKLARSQASAWLGSLPVVRSSVITRALFVDCFAWSLPGREACAD